MHLVGLYNWSGTPETREYPSLPGGIRLHVSNRHRRLENDRVLLVLEGIVFDRTDGELLADHTALDTAFGTFAYIRIDKATGDTVIGTDRLGLWPLYYAQSGNGLAFSTSLPRLKYLLPKASANYEAWQEILAFGGPLGTHTTISEINRLTYGTRLHLRGEGISFCSYWTPEYPDPQPFDGFCDRNNELIVKALDCTRSIDTTRIALMSGGMDSRRLGIAAAVGGLDVSYMTQSAIHKGNIDNDVIAAREVVETLGGAIEVVPCAGPAEWYNDALVRDYWLGFESSQHEWLMPLLRTVPSNSLLYDGFLGDVFAGGCYIFEDENWLKHHRDSSRLADIICAAHGQVTFNEQLLDSSLRDRVQAELDRLDMSPHRLTWFMACNRQRRSTALQPYLYYLHGHLPCHPFYYPPLVVQSLALEPHHYLGDLIQKRCAEHMHNAAANLPSTREELETRYVIPMKQVQTARDRLFDRQTRIRSDALEPFPGSRARLNVHLTGHVLRINRVAQRYTWLSRIVRRFGRYLDWLEDSSVPAVDCGLRDPRFIKDRLLQPADAG